MAVAYRLKVYAMSMIRPWSEIKRFYGELAPLCAPLQGMLRLVEQIEASRYHQGIHGWTSWHDLLITQHVEAINPYDGPYLMIAPDYRGRMEFRYVDTHIVARQWVRIVDESDAFARLERFFQQLHWFARP